MADLVDEHRAPVAAFVLIRPEHEVIEEQLPAPLEQVEQPSLAVRPVEDVVLLDLEPRQPAALGGERVSCPGDFLFLGKERLTGCLPLRRGDDRWKVHRLLSIIRILVVSPRPALWAARPFGVRSGSCQVALRTEPFLTRFPTSCSVTWSPA